MNFNELFRHARNWSGYIGSALGLLALVVYKFQLPLFGNLLTRDMFIDTVIGLSFLLLPFLFHLVNRVNKNMEKISEGIRSRGIRYISGKDNLYSRCSQFAENATTIEVIGAASESVKSALLPFAKADIEISFVSTLSFDSARLFAKELLAVTANSASDRLSVFYSVTHQKSVCVVFTNEQMKTVDVVVAHLSNDEGRVKGYFTSGDAAREVANTFRTWTTQNDRPVIKPSESLIKLYDEEVVDEIYLKGLAQAKSIQEIEAGLPLNTHQKICQKMKSLLENSNESLRVVHIAVGRCIDILNDPVFKDWLELNYSRAHMVNITRIFLIGDFLSDDETSLSLEDQNTLSEKRKSILSENVKLCLKHGVSIRYVYVKSVERDLHSNFVQDFSIYDENRVVFIGKQAGCGWAATSGDQSAIYTKNPKLVAEYLQTFNALLKISNEEPPKDFELH